MSNKKIISTSQAPAAVGPYSQAVVHNDLIFLSGQLPLDPATGNMVAGGIEEQTKQSLDNLNAILQAANSSLDKVLKVTIFVSDIGNFSTINEIYSTYFNDNPPARLLVEAAKIPKDALIEMDAIAFI